MNSAKAILTAISTRALVALLALLAVLLSHRVLSPQDFTTFNLVLFCLAMGTAFAAPVNRAFWIDDPHQSFAPSAASTIALQYLVLLIGYLLPNVIGGVSWSVTVVFLASAAYIFSRTIERFLYARTFSTGEVNVALGIMLIFSAGEAALLLGMFIFDLHSLAFRIAAPAAAFLTWMVLTRRSADVRSITAKLYDARKLAQVTLSHLFKRPGPSILILTGLATAAGMIDRLVLAYVQIFPAELVADYLLCVSYALALQTMLNILFDVARRKVYSQNGWEEGSSAAAKLILVGIAVVFGGAASAFPILTAFSIIPSSVPWAFWIAMILRAATLLGCYICFVDKFQKGEVLPVIGAAGLTLSVSLGFLLLAWLGVDVHLAAVWLCAFFAISTMLMFGRLLLAVNRATKETRVR